MIILQVSGTDNTEKTKDNRMKSIPESLAELTLQKHQYTAAY